MAELTLADKTRLIKKALTRVFFPEMRALGFQGGHGGFRRLTSLGVDVLVIRYDFGSFQLDAGRLPSRQNLNARTIFQDWGDYATSPDPKPGCARKSLYATETNYCFEYGDIKDNDLEGYHQMAESAVRSVKREGLPFWSQPRKK